MSYSYDEELYAEDPFANPYGYDEQAMIDYWAANGAGAGMLPTVQPGTGRALTVANRGTALNNYRSSMFDTAFQGLGGPQAFAPGAFDPIVSTSIRQSPELQQVYGYLRSPTSMEGIIAQEMMLGGTPTTAQRALQQMLTATPEAIAAQFAVYDEFFEREPTVVDAERIKANLLMELPAAYDGATQMPMEKKPDGTGVDWNTSEDMSVFAQARLINELQAEIPRVGPSEPKWSVDATGRPIQISSGGELSWGLDESGNPVLMETTVTESEAAKTFSDLGLPNPAEEYTPESFMSPEGIAMGQELPGIADVVAQYKAAWMDPSLAPTNRETMTPYKEGFAPGGGSGGGGGRGGWPGPPEFAYGGWNDPNEPDRTEAAAWQELMGGSQFGGWHTTNPLQRRTADDAMREAMTNAYGSWETLNQGETAAPGDSRDYAYGDWNAPEEGVAAPPPNTASDARNAWLASQGYLTNPSAASAPGYGSWEILNQSGQAQPAVDPTAVYGGWNTTTPTGAPSGPTGNPVAEALNLFVNSGRSQPANQPGGPGSQNPAILQAMLAQILPGNQQQTMNRPPPLAQPGAQPANQPGGPAYMEAIETGERREAQAEEDEQSAQILGGSTDRTGKRVRPTRTGEQARQYRAAFDAWDAATDEQQRAKQQYIQTARPGYAKAMARNYQEAGIRPFDQAMMARRLVLMNAGMPQGV